MKKLAILFYLLTFVSMISFKIIGSTIDPDGFLHEPFALIPLGYLSLLLALIFTLIAFFKSK